MLDSLGHVLKTGQDFYCFGLGLCKVIEIEDEAIHFFTYKNPENQIKFTQNELNNSFYVPSWRELASAALSIQDACNLSGVIHDFSRILRQVKLRLEFEGIVGTNNVQSHPVVRLYADKVASLASTQFESLSKDYDWAIKTAKLPFER